MDPRRYVVHNSLQEIQEDWKELEEDMNLYSNSTKSAKSIENYVHYQDQPQDREEIEDNMHQGLESVKYAKSPEITSYQERDIMNNKLQPDWDLEILKVGGYMGTTFPIWSGGRSYDNLIELSLTNCSNCHRIPTLGQLPALRSLTIETLQSVVVVGSEFFKADDCASLILPFPSLETLHFINMISWKKWHLIGMQCFPKLRTLRFCNCPKLIGHLPHQFVSLECLEIHGCPLLASSIPKCPNIHKLLIIKSQNVALQKQKLSPSLLHLQISCMRMLERAYKKLHVEDLCVRDCSDAVPFQVIHMPPSVKMLRITDCENLMFVVVSNAPLLYLQRISICNCKFLTSLIGDMERLLPHLEELSIERCPKMEPFSSGSLPARLKRLEILYCDTLLSCHTEWGDLPKITSLLISTHSQTWHCRGLQHLTSLQQLQILNSPNLKKIEGGMMPPPLQRLVIWDSCLLRERCREKHREIWPKISHVPYISLNGTDLRKPKPKSEPEPEFEAERVISIHQFGVIKMILFRGLSYFFLIVFYLSLFSVYFVVSRKQL